MARKRDPKRDEAYQLWKQLNGEITNRALAEQLGVPEKTISGWKSKDKWNDKLNGVLQKKIRSTPNKKPAKKARAPNKKQSNNETESLVESDELNDKQRLFCLYYIKYFNATKAYQKAYECAYATAMVNGHGLLRNTKIASEIDRLKLEQTNELKLDAKNVLQKYIDIAFADITDFVEFGQKEQPDISIVTGEPLLDENGDPVMYKYSFVNLKDDAEVDGTIITEVKKGKDGVSVKLADKMKALDMLAKYTNLLSDDELKQLEKEKAKAEIAKKHAEIAKIRGDDETEDYEDDGFEAALDSVTEEVWADEDDETEAE
ncbi:hypothetical protein BTO30_13530 [Domibacillus antri]|uniref:PBSX phage terminase small subunit-like N-terminal domain-containing protein n=1 Tax=Domibacillus antri TaxID=1714264 RepID=A0A1Q8Q2Z8_9BACI|nr:terminase small subunit [Domibacillus antri]OLN21717.1 hypothetical protein BTO30_13530 [Domibacillus antri]